MLRRLMGVLLALGVALTPTLALLHTHHAPHSHADHAADDGHTRQGDDPPGKEDRGDCGLCYLVHQARADLCVPVPMPAAPARSGFFRETPPDCPPRARTALVDAPPRGPPAV